MPITSIDVRCSESRRSFTFNVGATSCSRNVSPSSTECARVDFTYVSNALNLRPVAREHAQAPRIFLHLHHRLDTRMLESDLEAAYAREQADRLHTPTGTPSNCLSRSYASLMRMKSDALPPMSGW